MTIIAVREQLRIGGMLGIGAPTILRRREPAPPAPPAVTVTIHRQPLSVAADAQAAVCELWKRNRLGLPPTLANELSQAGLIRNCGFLSAEPTGPLIFRRIADATVRALGVDWARQQLGSPNEADPHSEYARQLAAEYEEAIEGGEAVYNHLVIHGLPRPVIYSHLLVGWTSPEGRKALLTCIDWPGV